LVEKTSKLGFSCLTKNLELITNEMARWGHPLKGTMSRDNNIP
jgi:hypothetical protein